MSIPPAGIAMLISVAFKSKILRMADNKKSFVLYCDLIHTVRKMSNNKAGELFKIILSYVNDENPEVKDTVVDLVFEPVKQQLKRDLKQWESERQQRSEAGRVGGLRSGASRNEAKRRSASKNEANEAVTVNVTDTVTDNVIKNISHSLKPDENFLLELPEMKVQSAIEYLNITKNVNVDRAVINSLWTVFKQKFFTGQKFYKSESDIFTHFFETLKFEKINGHKSTGHSVKTTGAYELVEKVRTITGGKAGT